MASMVLIDKVTQAPHIPCVKSDLDKYNDYNMRYRGALIWNVILQLYRGGVPGCWFTVVAAGVTGFTAL